MGIISIVARQEGNVAREMHFPTFPLSGFTNPLERKASTINTILSLAETRIARHANARAMHAANRPMNEYFGRRIWVWSGAESAHSERT